VGGDQLGPTWHHLTSIWQVGIKSINRYQVKPMRPIRLLGLHLVGFIGHHAVLKEHQGKPSGHQVEMEAWCSINGTRLVKEDQACIK